MDRGHRWGLRLLRWLGRGVLCSLIVLSCSPCCPQLKRISWIRLGRLQPALFSVTTLHLPSCLSLPPCHSRVCDRVDRGRPAAQERAALPGHRQRGPAGHGVSAWLCFLWCCACCVVCCCVLREHTECNSARLSAMLHCCRCLGWRIHPTIAASAPLPPFWLNNAHQSPPHPCLAGAWA